MVMDEGGGNGLGLLIIGALGLGALALVVHSRQSAAALVPNDYTPAPAERLPAGSYKNAEEWEITWSPEGLPTKVVIHRNATRI